MWKHFCIVPMRIHLLICIKLVGSRHWFRSIPVNLLLWDESIKVWLSDKLASSLGWTKAISNANKISCSVWWGCFWYGFDFKLGTSLTQNYPSIFAVYLKTSVHLLCQKKLRNHRSRPPPPAHSHRCTHTHHVPLQRVLEKERQSSIPTNISIEGANSPVV